MHTHNADIKVAANTCKVLNDAQNTFQELLRHYWSSIPVASLSAARKVRILMNLHLKNIFTHSCRIKASHGYGLHMHAIPYAPFMTVMYERIGDISGVAHLL